nr:uncharacterized protein LOC117844160 [Setaria viridis]
MGLGITEMLTPTDSPFYGIVPGNIAIPLGQVVLPITFATKEHYRTEYIKFEVADFKTSYHTIIGRPALAKFMAIPHYVYLLPKMLGPKGELSLRGDLRRSYECDMEAVEIAMTTQVPSSMQQVFTASKKLTPAELKILENKSGATKVKLANDKDFKANDLETGDSSKTALIGTRLDPKYESALVGFLQANRDIFAWKPADMPGVPREPIEHSLNVDPKATPKR